MRKTLGGFLLLLALYQGAWCVLFIATHLWSGYWFVRINVLGDTIAAVCCGIVGWHLVRSTPHLGPGQGPSDAEDDTAVTAS